MRVAIIGSRSVQREEEQDVLPYLPENTTGIVSGGAEGACACGAGSCGGSRFSSSTMPPAQSTAAHNTISIKRFIHILL